MSKLLEAIDEYIGRAVWIESHTCRCNRCAVESELLAGVMEALRDREQALENLGRPRITLPASDETPVRDRKAFLLREEMIAQLARTLPATTSLHSKTDRARQIFATIEAAGLVIARPYEVENG